MEAVRTLAGSPVFLSVTIATTPLINTPLVATTEPPVTTSIGEQLPPSPVYPAAHMQLFVPGPVTVQVALDEQPPLFVAHELIAVQAAPVPE